ncbi:hypothetical protein FCM35_KLT05977 [Carex littledalei]|uniref:DUF4283 domain-containing protein n=1 Tax=Carex littledalei TaxID=544730 RepID=A0A833QT30_9POAL|nr:hypothetical protein FCM35_KLT05977 [Carex littledalei]
MRRMDSLSLRMANRKAILKERDNEDGWTQVKRHKHRSLEKKSHTVPKLKLAQPRRNCLQILQFSQSHGPLLELYQTPLFQPPKPPWILTIGKPCICSSPTSSIRAYHLNLEFSSPSNDDLRPPNTLLNRSAMVLLGSTTNIPNLPQRIAKSIAATFECHPADFKVSPLHPAVENFLVEFPSNILRNMAVAIGVFLIARDLEVQLREWTPNLGMVRDPTSNKVRIKIHGLPLQYWNYQGVNHFLAGYGYVDRMAPVIVNEGWIHNSLPHLNPDHGHDDDEDRKGANYRPIRDNNCRRHSGTTPFGGRTRHHDYIPHAKSTIGDSLEPHRRMQVRNSPVTEINIPLDGMVGLKNRELVNTHVAIDDGKKSQSQPPTVTTICLQQAWASVHIQCMKSCAKLMASILSGKSLHTASNGPSWKNRDHPLLFLLQKRKWAKAQPRRRLGSQLVSGSRASNKKNPFKAEKPRR